MNMISSEYAITLKKHQVLQLYEGLVRLTVNKGGLRTIPIVLGTDEPCTLRARYVGVVMAGFPALIGGHCSED